MAVDISIVGPGLEASRRLKAGEAALILGRDADCTIRLPDPQRNVSRRHLSLWNQGDQLHFHVLSTVSGVQVSDVDCPPGWRGVLSPGQALQLSDYQITTTVVQVEPAEGGGDPWAEFEKEAAQLLSMVAAPPLEEDPFGDWGFQSNFGDLPDPASSGQTLDTMPATDLGAFFRGLGITGASPAALTQGELATIGRLTRSALVGLLQAQQAAGGTRQAVRSEVRAMLESMQANPLRMDTPLDGKLWFLFGGQAASAGWIAPEQAVSEVVDDLVARERAMADAARRLVLGVLHEFDPEALKARLLPGGARLFESARAWDAFVRDHAERSRDLEGWVRQLIDRYFAAASAPAVQRGKHHNDEGGQG